MSTSCSPTWMVAAAAAVVASCLASCTTTASPRAGSASVGYQAPASLVLDRDQVAKVLEELPASSPQRPLLQDGKVTTDELALSWRRLRACLQSAGLDVSGPYLNPVTRNEYLYTYARAGNGVDTQQTAGGGDDQAAQSCEGTYWTPLSLVYGANTPQRMDPTLAVFMTGCLSRAGYATRRAVSFDDVVRNGAATADPGRLRQAYACLDLGMPRLFPQLPYFPRP